MILNYSCFSKKRINPKLYKFLTEQGYTNLVEIEGRGICGLFRFIYTTGLVYGLTEDDYVGRYCFHSNSDAVKSLISWNGIGDPSGPWMKHKGEVEYRNLKLIEDYEV